MNSLDNQKLRNQKIIKINVIKINKTLEKKIHNYYY